MKLSVMISLLVAIMAAQGDVKVFTGDMESVDDTFFDVVDTEAENIEQYGEKYLHLGEV